MDNPIAAAFAQCRKFVLTHSDAPLEWQASERLADLDALAALKAGDGPNLVVQGSSTLYPQLLARGLLDRLVLITAPVTLGNGKRLFGEGTPPRTFKLTGQRVGSRGCAVTTFEPAGPVETGTFGPTDNPSPQERARQAKIEAGTW
jgi:dihydrofolate reductase